MNCWKDYSNNFVFCCKSKYTYAHASTLIEYYGKLYFTAYYVRQMSVYVMKM